VQPASCKPYHVPARRVPTSLRSLPATCSSYSLHAASCTVSLQDECPICYEAFTPSHPAGTLVGSEACMRAVTLVRHPSSPIPQPAVVIWHRALSDWCPLACSCSVRAPPNSANVVYTLAFPGLPAVALDVDATTYAGMFPKSVRLLVQIQPATLTCKTYSRRPAALATTCEPHRLPARRMRHLLVKRMLRDAKKEGWDDRVEVNWIRRLVRALKLACKLQAAPCSV
jgi:hypothetical protein